MNCQEKKYIQHDDTDFKSKKQTISASGLTVDLSVEHMITEFR